MKNYFYIIVFVSSLLSVFHTSNAEQLILPNFTSLVEQTGAAVVNITASQENKSYSGGFSSKPRNFQFPQGRDSVSGGSGFIISADGYILTNRHVIHNADEVIVTLIDRREFAAKLIGEDKASDIALLKVDAKDLPYLKIGNPSDSKIGEWVMAIGSPLSFEHSVTKGIISAKGRSLGRQQYIPYIQTDVPINRGNSGGPLINMEAEVIAINTLILSNTGGYMGLSFSIPIDIAMSVVAQLKSSGTVKRGLLGVNIQPVTQKMADYLKLKTPQGALVTNVNKGSAAEKAGIQEQDVIVSFNDMLVTTSSSLPPLVGAVMPGQSVKLNIVRDGKAQIIHAVLGGLDGMDESLAIDGQGSANLDLGFEIENLTEDIKQQLSIESGVIVTAISNRKIIKAGLKVGDVILKIAKNAIKGTNQFRKQLQKFKKGEPIVFLVKQSGVNRFIVIERE